MNKESKRTISALLLALLVGFALGLILWLTGGDAFALLWCPAGFGLFYLHMIWIKRINSSKSNIKLKQLI